MSDPIPCNARTATSLYAYSERLAAEQVAPVWAAVGLGLRWSFVLPNRGFGEPKESAPPADSDPWSRQLARRRGCVVEFHRDWTGQQLEEYLRQGYAAIVAVDVFFLPFRPAHGRVHSARTVIARPPGANGWIPLEDAWSPATTGTVSPEVLTRARYSAVPADPLREPLFSGEPVAGEWYSVQASSLPREPAHWASALLPELHHQMFGQAPAAPHREGIEAFAAFVDRFREISREGVAAPHLRRCASLLLRTELSSRLYLTAFLRAAAHWLDEPILAYETDRYCKRLGHLQSATDTLAKTVVRPRPEYDAHILRHLELALAAESALGEAVASRSERPARPERTAEKR